MRAEGFLKMQSWNEGLSGCPARVLVDLQYGIVSSDKQFARHVLANETTFEDDRTISGANTFMNKMASMIPSGKAGLASKTQRSLGEWEVKRNGPFPTGQRVP